MRLADSGSVIEACLGTGMSVQPCDCSWRPSTPESTDYIPPHLNRIIGNQFLTAFNVPNYIH
jgi:hypothetical protein